MTTAGNGYIALYRKILQNPVVCKDADHLAVWVWLLLNAVWDEQDVNFGGKKITLKPGQLTTGRKRIADELSVSESKVQRILKRFESEHQIEQRTDRQCRLISIVSWNEYQQSEQPNEHQMNNERTTSEQRVNTNKESNKLINNKYINIYTSKSLHEEFEKLWSIYPKKQGGKDKAYSYYERARKSGIAFEEIEQGIQAYTEYIKVNEIDMQFVKMGTTFFSQKAWTDDWSIRMEQRNGTNDNQRSQGERARVAERIERSIDDFRGFEEA